MPSAKVHNASTVSATDLTFPASGLLNVDTAATDKTSSAAPGDGGSLDHHAIEPKASPALAGAPIVTVRAGVTLSDESSAMQQSPTCHELSRNDTGSFRRPAFVPGNDPLTLASGSVVFASALLPPVAFITIFSVMGVGDIIYLRLVKHSEWCYVLLALACAIGLMLFVLDAHMWTGGMVKVRRLVLLLCICSISASCVLSVQAYPYAPLLYSMLCHAGLVFATRTMVLRRLRSSSFFRALSYSLWVVVLLCSFFFLLWMFVLPPRFDRLDNGWNDDWKNVWGGEVKIYWRNQMKCYEIEGDEAALQECFLGAFLWWAFPFWMNLPMVAFAVLSILLSRVLEKGGLKDRATSLAAKAFALLIVVFIAVLYVASSVAGAGIGYTRVVELGVMLFVFMSVLVVGNTLGWSAVWRDATNLKVYKKVTNLDEFWFDMARAFALFILFLPIACYLPLSAVNQLCRKCLPFTPTAEGGHFFTRSTLKRLAQAKRWHWASVLSKVSFWGILYLSLQVFVMQATVVFFSWLNEQLAEWKPAAVCGMFFVIGVAMFCLPPIPGVPVYVTAGVLIPASFMSAADENALDPDTPVPIEFWYGLAVACFVVFLVKMTAVVCEQELIGRNLGGYVSVRAAVKVNSVEMRATRRLLSQPGLSFAKCTILVGGPDWPTSVLTGILKLSCGQMLLGTVPILLLIVPSTAAGGFQLLTGKSDTYESLAALVTMFAMVMQLLAFVGAVVVIDRAATKHEAELQAMEPDEEVLKLEEKAKAFNTAWRETTSWQSKSVGLVPKILVLTSAVSVTLASYLAMLMPCFHPQFGVADSVSDDLNGWAFNLVLDPYGWAVLHLFVVGWALRLLHLRWAHLQAQKHLGLPAPALGWLKYVIIVCGAVASVVGMLVVKEFLWTTLNVEPPLPPPTHLPPSPPPPPWHHD